MGHKQRLDRTRFEGNAPCPLCGRMAEVPRLTEITKMPSGDALQVPPPAPQWDSLSLYYGVRGCREEAIPATASLITSRAFFTELAHDATPGSASTWFSGRDDKSSGRK